MIIIIIISSSSSWGPRGLGRRGAIRRAGQLPHLAGLLPGGRKHFVLEGD